tara:strand:- start:460 stop:1218 length:759 start_codon:yes stop_codon:yes gene_type:complete
MTTTFTVTVVSTGSGNKYAINGNQQATLNLVEGATYKFDQADSSNSGHPLRFSATSDGTHNSGSEYTTGVTTSGTPGNAGAFTQITVAAGAPTLYYYCSSHSGMGGTANTDVAISGWNRGTWNSGAWNSPSPVVVTGVSAAASIGTATVSITGDVVATGVSAATSIGTVTVFSSVLVQPSGVSSSASIGTVIAETNSTASVTGVSASTSVGDVQINLTFPVTGVSAQALSSNALVWSSIDDSQTPNWTQIAA